MAALRALDVLFTPSEERFDRITRLASRLLGTPIAVISLVADSCKWFKSSLGLDVQETSREISFCGHAILSDDTFVVEDATTDVRFADNPLVVREPGVRFYAAHPLHSADGSRVGALCVIDRFPRTLSPDDAVLLRDLAAIAERELQHKQLSDAQRELIRERDDLRLRASIDDLTHLWNRATIIDLLDREIARASRGTPFCVAMLDVDHFKKINDSYGHLTGDSVLVELGARIRQGVRQYDAVGRYGGEEFLLVLSNCDLNSARPVCERIRLDVSSRAVETPNACVSATVSIGLVAFDPAYAMRDEMVSAADEALYGAKKRGRNRIEVGRVDRRSHGARFSSGISQVVAKSKALRAV
jgi:diguanylate cyclase (GGDEF)-like protein